MSQTEVKEQLVGQVGALADSGFTDKVSALSEGDLPFGRMAVRGTDLDRQGRLPTGATDITDRKNLLGVVVRSQGIESLDFQQTPGDPRYLDKKMAPALRRGRIFVLPETAVDPSDNVFVRHTGGNEGKFRNDADGANASQVPADQARWKSTALAGEPAILEINL